MNDFVPIGDTVLCEPVEIEQDNSGFIYEPMEKIPYYKVLKVGSNNIRLNILIGDIILCNSTGNMFKENGKIYHLFSYNNIIGKINN